MTRFGGIVTDKTLEGSLALYADLLRLLVATMPPQQGGQLGLAHGQVPSIEGYAREVVNELGADDHRLAKVLDGITLIIGPHQNLG